MLQYGTQVEPNGEQNIMTTLLGLNVGLNAFENTNLHKHAWSHFTFDAFGCILLLLL